MLAPSALTKPVLPQQILHRRKLVAHALLLWYGKRNEPNIVQNSIIRPDEIHRGARGGQALPRGYHRLGRTRQSQAAFEFGLDIGARNPEFWRNPQGGHPGSYLPLLRAAAGGVMGLVAWLWPRQSRLAANSTAVSVFCTVANYPWNGKRAPAQPRYSSAVKSA